MKKLLVMGTTLLALLAAGAVAAPAAQAGVNPPWITVQSLTGCKPSATNVVGNPGDSVTVLVSNCTVLWNNNGGAPASASPTISTGGTIRVTLGSVGSGTVLLTTFSPATGTQSFTVNIRVTTDEVPDGPVHDDLQQVGVPASGSCADVPLEVGHYPGAPIGGWTKSWAQWINDGKGGPVCTRELEEIGGAIILIS